jgi:hypothetical protein
VSRPAWPADITERRSREGQSCPRYQENRKPGHVPGFSCLRSPQLMSVSLQNQLLFIKCQDWPDEPLGK